MAEPVHDQFQQAPIKLGAGNPGLARKLVADPGAVIREPLTHRHRNLYLAGRSAELIRVALEFRDVVANDRIPSPLQGFPRGSRSDKRIAIAVASDPGAEGNQFREIAVSEADPVNLAHRIDEFVVDTWQGHTQPVSA